MDDVLLQSLKADLSRVLTRMRALESEVQQLRRVREPKLILPRHNGYFAILKESLVQGATSEVERLVRNEDDDAWEASGELGEATDIWLNMADTVEAETVVYVVDYGGKDVIAAIYCAPNDWL